jgi:hypothetical protein
MKGQLGVIDFENTPVLLFSQLLNVNMQDKTQNASAALGGSISPDQQQHGTSGVIAPFFCAFRIFAAYLPIHLSVP